MKTEDSFHVQAILHYFGGAEGQGPFFFEPASYLFSEYVTHILKMNITGNNIITNELFQMYR